MRTPVQATADIRVTYTYDAGEFTEQSARERLALMLAGRVDNPDFPALAVDSAVPSPGGHVPPF